MISLAARYDRATSARNFAAFVSQHRIPDGVSGLMRTFLGDCTRHVVNQMVHYDTIYWGYPDNTVVCSGLLDVCYTIAAEVKPFEIYRKKVSVARFACA